MLAAATILVLAGCATSMKIELGKEPNTDRLEELKIDVSTAAKVEAVLGQPQGRGEVSSPSFGLKEAWLYEFGEIEGSTGRSQMLMVFLDDERRVYHGHLWFASGSLFSLTK